MVNVIGFWKTKEQSVTLAPNPKASGLSGVGNPETSWHKPYFISELEHHPESRPCTKALSILNVSKAGSRVDRDRIKLRGSFQSWPLINKQGIPTSKKKYFYLFNLSLSQMDKWIKMHWDSLFYPSYCLRKGLLSQKIKTNNDSLWFFSHVCYNLCHLANWSNSRVSWN